MVAACSGIESRVFAQSGNRLEPQPQQPNTSSGMEQPVRPDAARPDAVRPDAVQSPGERRDVPQENSGQADERDILEQDAIRQMQRALFPLDREIADPE